MIVVIQQIQFLIYMVIKFLKNNISTNLIKFFVLKTLQKGYDSSFT